MELRPLLIPAWRIEGEARLIIRQDSQILRTLIFGGAGFVGVNLVDSLLKQGSKEILVFDNFSMGDNLSRAGLIVDVVKGDMTSSEAVSRAIDDFYPERIFHLAANSDISASALDPSLDVRNTFLTTSTLAGALRRTKVKELVFSSSSAVFGEVNGPITEVTPLRPVSAYGWMKLSSELILRDLQRTGHVQKYLCIRFPNVTGRWQTHGVIHDLVKKLIAPSDSLEVLGDGSQLKPYSSVLDLVEAIVSLTAVEFTGELAVNIGPSDQITVSQIVNELLEISGLAPEVKFATERSGWRGDVPEYMFDLAKAESLIGKHLFRSSLTAIRESIKWELEASGR